jgi:hypothetical protein
VVRTTADAFLDCGRFEGGFARLRCDACGTERLLAFSFRRRGLCPSCAARTAALTAARLVESVLLPVPRRQVVLTIPKRLRIYFRVDRRLLAELARAAARAITDVVRVSTGEPRGAPGIILALQTFGQDLTFHLHIHALATEGLVRPDDTVVPVPTIDAPLLEHAFRRRVFNLLLRHQRITPAIVAAMRSWHHSGFSAHTAVRVQPAASQNAERVLRSLLRPPVANARTRTRAATQVEIVRTHPAPDGAPSLTLDPLGFLARATSHIPRPRQHQLRYYGAYAPRARGARRERLAAAAADPTPAPLPRADAPAARARRLSWAQLLRRVLAVEPLACPTCPARLRIISFLTDPAVVARILTHLRRTRPGLFPPPRGRPPPPAGEPTVCGRAAGHRAAPQADCGGDHGGRSHELAEVDEQVHARDRRRAGAAWTGHLARHGGAVPARDGLLPAGQREDTRGPAASRSRCAISVHQRPGEGLRADR